MNKLNILESSSFMSHSVKLLYKCISTIMLQYCDYCDMVKNYSFAPLLVLEWWYIVNMKKSRSKPGRDAVKSQCNVKIIIWLKCLQTWYTTWHASHWKTWRHVTLAKMTINLSLYLRVLDNDALLIILRI